MREGTNHGTQTREGRREDSTAQQPLPSPSPVEVDAESNTRLLAPSRSQSDTEFRTPPLYDASTPLLVLLQLPPPHQVILVLTVLRLNYISFSKIVCSPTPTYSRSRILRNIPDWSLPLSIVGHSSQLHWQRTPRIVPRSSTLPAAHLRGSQKRDHRPPKPPQLRHRSQNIDERKTPVRPITCESYINRRSCAGSTTIRNLAGKHRLSALLERGEGAELFLRP